jgi:hypothetical protein
MNKGDWKVIDEIATDLGVRKYARLKWRQRGVPPKWWLRIAKYSGGQITAEALQAQHRRIND